MATFKKLPPCEALGLLPVQFGLQEAIQALSPIGGWRSPMGRAEGVVRVLKILELRGWIRPEGWLGWRKNLTIVVPPAETDYCVMMTPSGRSFEANEFRTNTGWGTPWYCKEMLETSIKVGYLYKLKDPDGKEYYRRTRAGESRVEELMKEGYDLAALKKAVKA